MITTLGWPAIFMLLVVLVGIGLVLGAIFMRESRDPTASGIDWKGAISFTLALTALTFGVLQAPESGWDDPLVVVLLTAAVLLFVAFGLIERTVARPMLDLSLFRFPRFVGAQLLAGGACLCLRRAFGADAGPFHRDRGNGRDRSRSDDDCAVRPLARSHDRSGASDTLARAGHNLRGRTRNRRSGPLLARPLPCGFRSRCTGCTADHHRCRYRLALGLMDGLAVSVVPRERAGMATGIFSTSRVAGEGVALALVSAVLSLLISANLGAGAGDPAGSVAQRLVTGDLPEAAVLVPSMERAALLQGYSAGFSTLLVLLSAITMLTAIVAFLFLGRSHETVEDIEDEAEEAAATAMPPDKAALCSQP
jgi:hypothetical protein